MSLERDLQSKIAVIEEEITINSEATFYGTTIDTQGMRNLTVVVVPSREIGEAATELFRFAARDSADNVTFTAVQQIEVLPTRNYDANGQVLFNAVAPYEQTFGLTSCERYIDVGVTCSTYNDVELTCKLIVIMEAELKDFTDYDPNFVVDGLP